MKVERQSNGKLKVTLTCPLCGEEFQHGSDIYEGHKCSGYGFTVCDSCWENNWDGWAPILEAKVLAWLEEHDIEVPERNEKGWLPREF